MSQALHSEAIQLLSKTNFIVPRFRGSYLEPSALSQTDLFNHHQFILFNAIAGSGKTRVMAQLATKFDAVMDRYAWLRISGELNDANLLSRSLVTVFIQRVLGEHSASNTLLMSPAELSPGNRLIVALNELAESEFAAFLFLDDVQNLTDEAALGTVQILLDHAPPNLRVVIATRVESPLHLAKLRTSSRLAEFQSEDFRLTFDQTEKMAAALLADPELPLLRKLFLQTQGWPAGVRLCCEAVRRRARVGSGPVQAECLGTGGIRYFEEELLAGLSPDACRALGAVLIPHRLRRDLLLELYGHLNVAAFLDEYEAHHLLVRKGSGKSTEYLPTPLLRAFSRERLAASIDDPSALHRRCCDWFEAAGDLRSAAEHAVEGNDPRRAAALIAACGMDMIAEGHVSDLRDWLNRLPMEFLSEQPQALLAVAWSLSLLYRLDDAAPLMTLIEPEARKRAIRGDKSRVASIEALEIMQLSMRDHLPSAMRQASAWIAAYPNETGWSKTIVDNAVCFSFAHFGEIEKARQVVEGNIARDVHSKAPYADIYSRCILGLIDLLNGEIDKAKAHFSWSLRTVEELAGGMSTAAVMAAGLLAAALYERNDVRGAQRLIDAYAWHLHAHLFTDTRFLTFRTYSRILRLRRHHAEARVAVDRVLIAESTVKWVRLEVNVLGEKVFLALDQHDFRMAQSYIRSISEQISALDPEDEQWRSELEGTLTACTARLNMHLKPAETIQPLTRLVKQDLRAGWKLRALQRSIMLVKALWLAGRQRASVRLLEKCVQFAADRGIVRSILDEGDELLTVLDRLIDDRIGRHQKDARLTQYVEMLREGLGTNVDPFDSRDEIDEARQSDQFTEREKELIRLIKRGLSNREMAGRMNVSENTIKWHLKNIFRKVSVTNRAEFRRRA